MSFFDNLFRGGRSKKDPYEKAPALKQMAEDLKKEEDEFIERFEKILPVLRVTQVDNGIFSGGEDGHVPTGSLPVSYPIDFDDEINIFLGIDTGDEYEWLLNRHIEVASDRITPDKIVSKAFGNLFKQIEKNISVSMLTDETGILENCNFLESSLVLINEVWSLARRFVKGDDIIFAIPARDVFIFTRSGNEESLVNFRNLVRHYLDDPAHPDKLSSKLYVKHKNGKAEIMER
jgi:hypothetical protein